MDTKPPKWEQQIDPPPPYASYGATANNFKYPQTNQRYLYPQQAVPANNEGCWFERNQKNKPQSNSIGAGALIFTCGGMSMAWGLGFNPWLCTSIYSCNVTSYMNVCWFVMAIVGAVVSAALINSVKKKTFMILSSALTLLSGILFLSLYDEEGAIMAARHLNGFAIGLIFVPTLVMGGEEAIKDLRGMITSSIEMMCFSLGTYLQIIYAASWVNVDGFTVNQMHGLLLILFSVMSIVIASLLVVESPVYFLVRNEEQAAIDCLRRLQRPFVVTSETFVHLEELKSYVAYNKEKSRNEAIKECLPALFKLCILRGIVAMSFTLVLNLALIKASDASQGYSAIWPAILYGTCRYIGILVSVFMQDSIGRKKPLAFGMLTSGVLAIAIAICFTGPLDYEKASMTTAMIFLIFYQFFIGIAIASSSPYLSEAFPLAVKPYCIACVFIFEMLVQIIGSTTDLSSSSYCALCYVLGPVSIAYFFLTKYCMPETKKTTLLDAQKMFQSCCNRANN